LVTNVRHAANYASKTDIGSMGESALKRRASGTKHKDLIKLLEKDTKVVDFLKPPSAAAATK